MKDKKTVVLDVQSAAHLKAFCIKQGVLFFKSLMFWACTEACTCDLMPHMQKPDVCLSVCVVLYTGLFSSRYTSLGYHTQTPNLSKM